MERANKMYQAKSLHQSSKSGFRRRDLSCIKSGTWIMAVFVVLAPFICVFFWWNRPAIDVVEKPETADNSESLAAAVSPLTLDVQVLDDYGDTLAELDQQLLTSAKRIKAGSYHEAMDVLSAMLERNPDEQMSAVIYYNRGLCNYYLADYPTAIEDFEMSIIISPFAKAYYSLGLTYAALDQNTECMQKAIEAYSYALEQEPENVNYLLVRAGAYEAVEEISAAYEDYCAVLELEPGNIHACAGLERLKSI